VRYTQNLAAAIGASVLRALLSRPKVVAVVHAGDDTAGAAATVAGAKAIETGVAGHRSGVANTHGGEAEQGVLGGLVQRVAIR
jgi:hypothetical protein